MDKSLATWLQIREPADAAARSDRLTRTIADAVATSTPLQVLDLGTGAGSNVRYLAPRLPGPQRWLAIDRDAGLLTALQDRMSSWGAARTCEVVRVSASESAIRGEALDCEIETRPLDLGILPGDIFAGRHLVTASALLDLVSETWLMALAARCRDVGAAALFTITYNGWSSCAPAEPEDESIRLLLNRHQRRDKGLGGAAAGPAATDYAARCFADVGYRVWTEPSDWRLGPAAPELQRRLVDGWAEAATELTPEHASRIADWRTRRLDHIAAGRSHIVVGHRDLAACLPPDVRRMGA